MTILICGIKNCDTMKKAFNWLDAHNIAYEFHDYKKDGLNEDAFALAVQQHGWDVAINRRGTSWRKLSDEQKADVDDAKALTLAQENPSLVKRPLCVKDGESLLGFSEDAFSAFMMA